jgi:hypothetical protein
MLGLRPTALSAILKLQNKKNTLAKIWRDRKNSTIFALSKNKKMRHMLHIKSTERFSPIGDYTVRGACFAIE